MTKYFLVNLIKYIIYVNFIFLLKKIYLFLYLHHLRLIYKKFLNNFYFLNSKNLVHFL